MKKFLFSILILPLLIIFSACSDSNPSIESIGDIPLPLIPPSDKVPVYGEGPLTGNQDDSNDNGSTDGGSQEGGGTPPDVTPPPPPQPPACDLDAAAISQYFTRFDGTNNSSMKLYSLKLQGDGAAYSYNGLGIYMLNLGSSDSIYIRTRVFTFADSSDTSSAITSYEYVKYGGIDISSIGENNIDADTCSIKISDPALATTIWTKDDMNPDTGEEQGSGSGGPKSVVIYIDPKTDTIKMTTDSKTIEASAKNATGPLENKMAIP